MKTLTVTELARNLSAVLDDIERGQEEVMLLRNRRPIARLVPEPPAQNALEVLGDLYRTLDENIASALERAIEKSGKGRPRETRRVARSVGFLIDTGLWIDVERGRLSAADITDLERQFPHDPGLRHAERLGDRGPPPTEPEADDAGGEADSAAGHRTISNARFLSFPKRNTA